MENYKKRLSKLLKWKIVPGYQLESNRFGDIRDSITKKIKKCIFNKGYELINVEVNGKRTTRSVHSLVALTFIGPKPSKKHEVNHKDLVKDNNYYKNLEWCTSSQNKQHAIRNGHRPDITGKNNPCYGRDQSGKNNIMYGVDRSGEKSYSHKLTWKKVKIIRKSFSIGKHTIKELAKNFKMSYCSIWDIVSNKTWKLKKISI